MFRRGTIWVVSFLSVASLAFGEESSPASRKVAEPHPKLGQYREILTRNLAQKAKTGEVSVSLVDAEKVIFDALPPKHQTPQTKKLIDDYVKRISPELTKQNIESLGNWYCDLIRVRQLLPVKSSALVRDVQGSDEVIDFFKRELNFDVSGYRIFFITHSLQFLGQYLPPGLSPTPPEVEYLLPVPVAGGEATRVSVSFRLQWRGVDSAVIATHQEIFGSDRAILINENLLNSSSLSLQAVLVHELTHAFTYQEHKSLYTGYYDEAVRKDDWFGKLDIYWRSEGYQAWTKSPRYQQYVALAKDTFQKMGHTEKDAIRANDAFWKKKYEGEWEHFKENYFDVERYSYSYEVKFLRDVGKLEKAKVANYIWEMPYLASGIRIDGQDYVTPDNKKIPAFPTFSFVTHFYEELYEKPLFLAPIKK